MFSITVKSRGPSMRFHPRHSDPHISRRAQRQAAIWRSRVTNGARSCVDYQCSRLGRGHFVGAAEPFKSSLGRLNWGLRDAVSRFWPSRAYCLRRCRDVARVRRTATADRCVRRRVANLGTHGASGPWHVVDAAGSRFRESLLYVLDQHEVTVYKYPQGKLVGKLKNKNLYLADGACVDMKGDVYVANYGTDQLFEYRHGGKDLVRTIRPPVGSTGCTVDPATGNLAVAGNSGLVVYKRARGEPTVYTNSAFEAYYYCGYDDQGNLFVDGYNQPGSGHTILAELPQGGSTLQPISLNQVIQWPGQVQWDGKHLTVEDIGGASHAKAAVPYMSSPSKAAGLRK